MGCGSRTGKKGVSLKFLTPNWTAAQGGWGFFKTTDYEVKAKRKALRIVAF